MNEIQVFNNTEFGNIRTLEADGKVLFCGKDVATSLGYSDPKKAIIQHCKEDGVAIYPLTDNLGRTQQAKFITEGNLYRLISHSKLPTAERFESWVFDEVLPTIRRTGSYQSPQMSQLEMIAGIAQGAFELEQRQKALETQQDALETKVKAVSEKLNQALDVFTEGIADPDWKGGINRKINHVCKLHNLNYVSIRHDMYVELEHLAHCNLNTRVKRKQDRLRAAGEKYKAINEVSKLDVIAEDARLRAIFDGIVKRLEARYIQGANVQLGMSLDDLIDF